MTLSADRLHLYYFRQAPSEPSLKPHGLRLAALLCVLCLLPAVLMSCGIDFSSRHDLSGSAIESLVVQPSLLRGSYTHTILEWSAVGAAAFACLLCLSYFVLSDEPSVPVIAIALACAGAMDAFGTLAADHLIVATVDNRELIPFTWALSRLFNSVILLVGLGLLIRHRPAARGRHPRRTKRSVATVCLLGMLFVVLAGVLVVVCAQSGRLPRTMFPASFIKRPYDVVPIAIYLLSAVTVFPLYYRRRRSIFALAIFLSLIPQIAAQLYMVFGSQELFDGAFNVAHVLKVLGYAVPCLGILAESWQTHRDLVLARQRGYTTEQELLGYSCQLEDTRKRVERQAAMLEQRSLDLDAALREVEQGCRAKSEFLANMSHEIRTPMTAILGFIDVLGCELSIDEKTTELQEIFGTIQRNGNYLLELIDDILDLSKIESGRLEIERIACSPVRLMDDVVSLMRVRADAKNLSIEVRWDGSIPDTIWTDPTRLRQILINLIGNAIKFTERGSVLVVGGLLQEPGLEPRMQYDVIDTGIGMTRSQMEGLFQPFSQADSSTTRKHGGTGLGLAISKRLAMMLGGMITVESAPAQGSTFTVTISTGPIHESSSGDRGEIERSPAEAQTETLSPEEHEVPPGCRVLLAEDGPDNQRLIAFLLKKAGIEVTIVGNGREAVDRVLSMPLEMECRFDVILMDMQMPVLDGYNATAELRQSGYVGAIIALTAHAMDGDREKCLAAGCDDYTAKPIDREKLISLVCRYAKRTQPQVVGLC